MNQKSKVIKYLQEKNFWPNGGYGYKVFLRKYIFDKQTNKYVGYLKNNLIVCLDEEFKNNIERKRYWSVKL